MWSRSFSKQRVQVSWRLRDLNIESGEKISRPVAKMANLLVRKSRQQDRIQLPNKGNRTVFLGGYNTANIKFIPTGRRVVSEKQNRNVSTCGRITDHWSVAALEYPTRAASPTVTPGEFFSTTGDVVPSKRGITTHTTPSVQCARHRAKA